MTYQRWPYLSVDERLRHLEDELYLTRRAVLALLPADIRQAAEGYHRCVTREDAHAWEEQLVEQVIASVQPLSIDEGSHLAPRAYCPLCEAGSSAPYDRGFALPEGLRRHLTGWGNRCEVLAPIVAMARDYLEPKFQEADAARAEDRRKVFSLRRKTEILYRLSPDAEPKLFDEDLGLDGPARDQPSLAWAEDRLETCGCLRQDTDRVRSFTIMLDGCVAYGDPRPAGKVKVTVHRELDVSEGRRRRGTKDVFLESFSLPDTWKRNIETKFRDKLLQAVEAIDSRRLAR